MSERISQSQLESYLWSAMVLLRGYIAPGDYKQFIFPLLFYKRLASEIVRVSVIDHGRRLITQ